MSINYQCTSCYSDCRVQPIISWQDFSSIMVDGFLVVAICVSGIAFAPILYQDMICLRVLHYGFLSIFVMAHSSQSMDQRVRRIVFSCGERVQHDVRQCACHFQPFQVHSVLVPSVPALWTIRPRSWYSQDGSVCAVWCRSCGMMHTHNTFVAQENMTVIVAETSSIVGCFVPSALFF